MSRRQSEKVWSGVVWPPQQIAATGVQNTQTNACLPSAAAQDEYTVIRIVGHIRYQHPGGTGSVIGAAGIAVLPYTGSGDIATILNPLQDLDYPWLWWQPICMGVGSGETGSMRAMQHFQLDIRSKRVVDRKTNLVLLTTIASNSVAVTLLGGVRVLLLD